LNAAASPAKDQTPWTARAYETALLAADPRRTVEQTAPRGERRAVGHRSALAAPRQVPAALVGSRIERRPVAGRRPTPRRIHGVRLAIAQSNVNVDMFSKKGAFPAETIVHEQTRCLLT
jgi:hypothetical protein